MAGVPAGAIATCGEPASGCWAISSTVSSRPMWRPDAPRSGGRTAAIPASPCSSPRPERRRKERASCSRWCWTPRVVGLSCCFSMRRAWPRSRVPNVRTTSPSDFTATTSRAQRAALLSRSTTGPSSPRPIPSGCRRRWLRPTGWRAHRDLRPQALQALDQQALDLGQAGSWPVPVLIETSSSPAGGRPRTVCGAWSATISDVDHS